LEGSINVKIQLDGKAVDVPIHAGEMFLLPGGVPHSPGRSEGSIGVVVERVRAGKGFKDGLLWFCEHCNNKLYETYFELQNIEQDFLPHFKHYYNSESLRTCTSCGHVMERDPRFVNKD
jgi:3-hydroxyanthranilate 3,4-dioxygenase